MKMFIVCSLAMGMGTIVSHQAALPTVAVQTATFGSQGHEVFVATPGHHGASALDAGRVEGDVEPTWSTVLAFLARSRSGGRGTAK